MSAAQALEEAHAAGVRVEIDGGDLVLEAPAPPPPAVLDLLSRHKAGIVEMLAGSADRCTTDWVALYRARLDEAQREGFARAAAAGRAYDACLRAWLTATPAAGGHCDLCAECGLPRTEGAAIIPYGTESFVWLHDSCWAPWSERRLREASAALATLGIVSQFAAGNGGA